MSNAEDLRAEITRQRQSLRSLESELVRPLRDGAS